MIVRGEVVLGIFGGEVLVVVELEKLFVEGRVVGKDADRIIVDVEAGFCGLDDDASAGSVANDPVEFGGRELGIKIEAAEIEVYEADFGFFDGGALAEEPGEEFELGDVVFAVDMIMINSVTDEI